MKIKSVYVIVIFALIFAIISKAPSAKCFSNVTSITNKIIYSVNNKQDFCTILPYCINNNIPLVMSNTDVDTIREFSIAYNGDKVKLENKDILELIKEQFHKDTLIISSDKDNRIVVLGGQIASNLNCPIIYESNIGDFFTNNNKKYKKIILLGDVNFEYKGDSEVVKYNSIQDIQHLYDENISNYNLNVYIENNEYDVYGLYLAAHRKGKIYFTTDNIEDMNKYFAWVVKPEYFSPKRYLEIYSKLEKKSNNNFDKGIGVITGKTYEDVNLLLLRSFFYNEIDKGENILNIELASNEKSESIQWHNGTYEVIRDNAKDLNDILKKMKDSKYIRLFGHGSHNSIELEDKVNLNLNSFPKLKSTVVIAEACSTGEKLDDTSIALKAIENGAVSYVGSIKVGGVESLFCDESYLISTEEIPLSNLVLANNIEIKNYMDNSIRAVLIGDPLFSLYKNIGIWNTDGSYDYSLANPYNKEHVIPLKVEKKFEGKSVAITENSSTNSPSGIITRVVHMGKSSIVFVTTKTCKGKIQFNNYINMKQLLNKVYSNSLRMINNFAEGFLSITFINMIQIVFCSGILVFILKRQGKIKNLKNKVILAMVGASISLLVEYVLLNISPSYFLFIYNVLLYFSLFLLTTIKYRFLLLSIDTIIPVYLVLVVSKSNIYMYVYLLLGILLHILIQLLICIIIDKANDRIKLSFKKSFNI